MKLVIHTQIRENYGAHDWDGQGDCPQRWKCKGGNTYVVLNLTEKQIDKIADSGIPTITSLISEDNDYYNEYVSLIQSSLTTILLGTSGKLLSFFRGAVIAGWLKRLLRTVSLATCAQKSLVNARSGSHSQMANGLTSRLLTR